MNPLVPEPPARPHLQGQLRKNLSSEQTREIVSTLLWELKDSSVEGKFWRGVVSRIANTLHETRIRRIWARALINFCDPNVRAFRALPQKKCGRTKRNHDEVREAVKEIPLHHKRTLRDLAATLGMPLTSLFRMKSGRDRVFMPFTSALKPALTEFHKVGCVVYSVSKRNPVDLHYKEDFYNSVHVDEKWFFLSEKELHLYIATDKTVPQHRTCQNKDHIMKVTFLTAVARPPFSEDGICTFDGKIRMFPFVNYIPAQQASRNCAQGVFVTTPFSATKNKYQEFMVNKVVIPAINGLIKQVKDTFEEFDPRKIDFGFITLQTCMNDILKA
jgi:hypothetical protein